MIGTKHYFPVLLLACCCLFACKTEKRRKPKWEPNLEHASTEPYGSSLAYAMLNKKTAEPVKTLNPSFRITSLDETLYYNDQRNVLFLLGNSFYLSTAEMKTLFRFARSGNEVMLVAGDMDAALLQHFSLKKNFAGLEFISPNQLQQDSLRKHGKLALYPYDIKEYNYKGRSILSTFQLDTVKGNIPIIEHEKYQSYESESTNSYGYFTKEDSVEILGTFAGKPNYFRFSTGEGHITLHASPLAFSNYFLLQEGNEQYVAHIFNTLLKGTDQVYWIDFKTRSAEKSSIWSLLKYPAFKWAFWLSLLGLALYLLLESRRRQRIIPILPTKENSTVIFAETVGRLYHQKGDHHNLAEKMIQHFLEQIRLQYYLPTNHLDEEFVTKLSNKSGKPLEQCAAVVQKIHELRLSQNKLSEQELYNLYHQLNSFQEELKPA